MWFVLFIPHDVEFRKIVVSSILATDMSLHGDYVEKIKTQASRLANMNVHTMDPTTLENERLLICSALIKCADISNVVCGYISCILHTWILMILFLDTTIFKSSQMGRIACAGMCSTRWPGTCYGHADWTDEWPWQGDSRRFTNWLYTICGSGIIWQCSTSHAW